MTEGLTPTYTNRFWAQVKTAGPTECWEWDSYRTDKGYGHFQVSKKVGPKRAHRIAYHLATGQDPGELHVLHRCDNPPCCNPAHLFLGTHQDNMRDMIAKGRRSKHVPPPMRGALHPRAKLTQEKADEIRRLYAAGGISQTALGLQFGVPQPRISKIVRGEAW